MVFDTGVAGLEMTILHVNWTNIRLYNFVVAKLDRPNKILGIFKRLVWS